MKHFNYLNPPSFTGNNTTVEAEEWSRQIQKIFNTMCITEDWDQVRLTSFCFISTADGWWDELARTKPAESFTWTEFVNIFYLRFFPRATKQELADRFGLHYQGIGC